VFAVVLVYAGLAATGAIAALPIATTLAMLVALVFLRDFRRPAGAAVTIPQISLGYSTYTLLGLLAFAILVNLDAIAVKRFFSPAVAGDYGTVVTLGKICLFATLGIGLVLFPKAAQRESAGRDSRQVVILALVATFALGAVLTGLFFLASDVLVEAIFTDAYSDPGPILGLVGIATTLYAGVNIWLNYALSLDRRSFIYLLAVLVLLAIAGMALFHVSISQIVAVMIIAGVAGNIAGAATTLKRRARA
jgi:O-antigen/teichoic acid export membrane protein